MRGPVPPCVSSHRTSLRFPRLRHTLSIAGLTSTSTTASPTQESSETTPLMAKSDDYAGADVPPIFKDTNVLEDECNDETRTTSLSSLSPAEVAEEQKLRLKVDFRLCSIAGLLCSLNLLDSGVISNAAVTSMLKDLQLDVGKRYSVSIFIFTIASIVFNLPSTIAVRKFGPRIWFAFITFSFGLITLCTAFVTNWKQMIALRILLGMAMAGIYPGLSYLISTWYTREEQQLRFALLQCGEVIVLATGGFVNFGLNRLSGHLKGWQWMFLVQGLITSVLGIVTYWVSCHCTPRLNVLSTLRA